MSQRSKEAQERIGRAVWLPATPEDLQALEAAAESEMRTLGKWLLRVALQKIGRLPGRAA